MKNNLELLEKGSYGKLLLNLCLPTVVIMIVMVIYNMADTFFVGQIGNPDMLAAVSLCTPIFTILSGLGTLFGNGGCTLISLCLGKGEKQKIEYVNSFCFIGAICTGLVFMIVVLCSINYLVELLGCDVNTVEYTKNYFRIIAIGAPAVMFNGTFCNIIRADGAAISSMICNMLGTVLNIVLDALFILVFNLGVEGAAWATILGNVASCIYLVYYMKKNGTYSMSLRWHPEIKMVVGKVIAMGLPLACSTLVMSVSNMISNYMMMQYGSTALAAQGIAGKLGMLISMLAMGVCMGLQPAMTFAHGRKDRKRIQYIIKNTMVFTFVVGVTIAVLGCIFRKNIINAFINNPDIMKYGQVMIFGALIVGPIAGWYQLTQVYLQATENPKYATIVALLDKGIFYLPILLVFARVFGVYGIAFAQPVTTIFSLIVGFIFCMQTNKKSVRLKSTCDMKK